MATFRRAGTIHKLRDDFIEGMVGNGYEREFAERCFKQIEGFGEYGFPESHAASFAILVYDLVLGEVALPRGLRRRPAQLPADGFLCAGPARARCARARRRGAAARHQCQRLGLHAGAEPQQSLRPAPRLAPGHGPLRRRCQAHGRAPHRALSRSGRSVAAFRSCQAPDRGAGPGRCLRFTGTLPSRRVVGGARLFRCRCRCSMARRRCATSNRPSPCPRSPWASRWSTIMRSISMSLRSHPLALLRPTPCRARRGAD